ncbi:MAG: hypothetical protein AAF958_15235 [Planctomycetota bacterium]
MAGARIPGPMGSGPTVAGTHGHGIQASGHTRSSTVSLHQPGSIRQHGLTPEQEELALDIAQLALDIVGIFEPTPFADGTNALISIGRGDWLGAGLSIVGIVPYVGDLAKAGKLPKYARSIGKAIDLARVDPGFARQLEPALKKLKGVLDDLPMDAIPDAARQNLAAIKSKVDGFLSHAKMGDGAVSKALKTLDANLRGGFKKAVQLPPQKNPRPLKKHPGPVSQEKLVKELEGKGFVKVKEGNQTVGGTRKGGNVGDSESTIYMRRVVDEKGASQFESVRIDDIKTNPNLKTPKNENRPSDGAIRKIKGDGPGDAQPAAIRTGPRRNQPSSIAPRHAGLQQRDGRPSQFGSRTKG